VVLTTGVLAVAGSSQASEVGVAQSAAPQLLVLLPRDEAADDAAFLAFRGDLLAKLRAGEFAAVAAMAHPNIKLSFGGSSGRETLHRWLIENPASDGGSLRQELERAITLGGVFLGPDSFCTPYVFCLDIPGCEACDPYEILVAVREAAPVYAAPDTGARVIARLAYGVVTIIDQEHYPWRRVRLTGDGGEASLEGYVTAPDFRSPIDHRAIFERQSDDSWLMTLFIAGD
jgi:hypothetical protein